MTTPNTPRLVVCGTGKRVHATIGTTGKTLCGKACVMPSYTDKASCKVCARRVAALREEQHAATDGTRTDAVPASVAVEAPELAPADAWCDSADNDGALCGARADVVTAYGPMCAAHSTLAEIEHDAATERETHETLPATLAFCTVCELYQLECAWIPLASDGSARHVCASCREADTFAIWVRDQSGRDYPCEPVAEFTYATEEAAALKAARLTWTDTVAGDIPFVYFVREGRA